MFKKAYVRGVTSALVQAGHAAFPSEEVAAKVADHIADNIGDINLEAPIPPAENAKIANHVIDAANAFRERGTQPGPFAKMASTDDLQKHAHAHAIDLMEKAAEGSNYTGGDKGNDSPSAAEGKADEKERPKNYATDAQGEILHNIPGGAVVGHEERQPAEPKNHPEGTNSLTEASKAASLDELMKKVAIAVASPAKDPRSSAESKAEQKDRTENYARLPHQGALGSLMQLVGGNAVVGKELVHPSGPSNHPAGTNSLTEISKKSSVNDDDPYIALFKKVAQEVEPHLPKGLTDDQKVAHIRSVMGLNTDEKVAYLVELQKQMAQKVGGEMPPQFAENAKKKDDKDEKKDDEKKDDKDTKHDLPPFMQKKESAAAPAGDDLTARLRAITQAVGAK